MMGRTLLEAGTVVLIVSALLVGLVTLAVVLSIDALPGVDATSPHIDSLRAKIIEWAGLTFGALLAALGLRGTTVRNDRQRDDDREDREDQDG